jgi:mRNA interferase MazF
VIRGDVHAIALPRRRGHVQEGGRYAVVVQADDLLALSTVVVCPTSRSALGASFRPEIAVGGERTRALCEMVRAVDVRSLGDRVGHLTLDEIAEVDDALQLVLGLD